jgi:sarcosine oxidase gamma subunit
VKPDPGKDYGGRRLSADIKTFLYACCAMRRELESMSDDSSRAVTVRVEGVRYAAC